MGAFRCQTVIFAAVLLLTRPLPGVAAEVIDDFSNTNNLFVFGGAISLTADDNILTAERTTANVDTGFDWRVDWFFSLDSASDQSQFQLTALQPLNGGFFVINALVFEDGNYLGEFTLQGDLNASGTFGYDIAAAAAQAGWTNANQWFPRIRITPFGSEDAGFNFSNFGAVGSASTVVTSGTLAINTTTTLGSGGITLTNGSQLFFHANRTLTNNLTIGTGSYGLLNAASGVTATYSGNIDKNGSTLIFAGSGATHVVESAITGSAGGSDLAIDGTTVTLSGQSTYNGPTFVYGGGQLNLAATQALPAGTALVIGAGSTGGSVTLQGFDQTVASLATGSSSGNSLTLEEATLTVSGGDSTTFAGTIGGSGGLTKAGAGTLTLAGSSSNTFAGTTTVSGGTLNLAKSDEATALAGSITVGGNATLLLSSSGQVASASGQTITLSGGTILRGSGVVETFGDLLLTSQSTLDFGTGTPGSISFGSYTPSSLQLVINHFTKGNTLYFRSDLSASIGNTELFSFTNGGLGSYSWDEGSGVFTITAIPETPAVFSTGLMLGMLVLLGLRRTGRIATPPPDRESF